MCGIAGYIGDKKFSKSKISKLFDLMKRRGPDSKGIKIIKEKKKSINFFFTRLSILDNSSYGNQPYVFKNKTLIFNGELYNYLEIKNELIKHGYKFSTTSDTEVLIKALDKWGIGCLKKLEGMWAFFFHDEEKNVSYLCRDRFGEKPLFYMKRLNELFFGSEIKFIKHMHEVELKINYDKLEDMLRYGYKSLNQNNDSNFKGVKNVPPGNYLKIDGDKLEMIRYWKVSHNPLELNEKDYIELLREKFFKAIEIRLRSDFPIAFFLSGGVDSNALAFIAKKHFNYNLKTFSIVGTDKKYDESELINYSNTHLKTDNTKLAINLRENDFIKSLKKQIQYHDSPVATINSHLNFLLYEKVNKDGFKVSISGIGCDEIFSGYYDHHLLYLNEVKDNDDLFLESKKNWNRDIKDIVRNPYLQDQDLYINNPENIYFNMKNLKTIFLIKKEITPLKN